MCNLSIIFPIFALTFPAWSQDLDIAAKGSSNLTVGDFHRATNDSEVAVHSITWKILTPTISSWDFSGTQSSFQAATSPVFFGGSGVTETDIQWTHDAGTSEYFTATFIPGSFSQGDLFGFGAASNPPVAGFSLGGVVEITVVFENATIQVDVLEADAGNTQSACAFSIDAVLIASDANMAAAGQVSTVTYSGALAGTKVFLAHGTVLGFTEWTSAPPYEIYFNFENPRIMRFNPTPWSVADSSGKGLFSATAPARLAGFSVLFQLLNPNWDGDPSDPSTATSNLIAWTF
jgi:hypothetical protein